jgi:hypothetical protein
MVQVKAMRLVQLQKWYVKTPYRENTIQNICFLDSQLMMLEKTGQSVYSENSDCRQQESK